MSAFVDKYIRLLGRKSSESESMRDFFLEATKEEISVLTVARLTYMETSAKEGDRLAHIARCFGTRRQCYYRGSYEDGNLRGYDDWRDYVRDATESEED